MRRIDSKLAPGAAKHLHLFRKRLPIRVNLHEILRALGTSEGQMCLDIGADNGVMSYHLRRRGGDWHTAVMSAKVAESVSEVVGENVHVLEGQQTLPFENKTFDAIVVVDFLERVHSDDVFIEECHRILKPAGRLVLSVTHVKSWTIIKLVQRLLGLTYEKKGLVRPGYSESQLFSILKHGFDVHNMRSYSRFLVEFIDTIVRFAAERMRSVNSDNEERAMRVFSIADPLYRLAFQFDMLLFFTRGFHLIATAKRRAWRPRRAPVLIDGRSISEVVLSKAAD